MTDNRQRRWIMIGVSLGIGLLCGALLRTVVAQLTVEGDPETLDSRTFYAALATLSDHSAAERVEALKDIGNTTIAQEITLSLIASAATDPNPTVRAEALKQLDQILTPMVSGSLTAIQRTMADETDPLLRKAKQQFLDHWSCVTEGVDKRVGRERHQLKP